MPHALPRTAHNPLPSAQTLAGLLRIDKLAKLPSIAGWTPDELREDWWLLVGRVELARGTRISAEDMARLLEPVAGWPTLQGLTMNRAMWFLWNVRPELPPQYPLKTPEHFADYLCWFYSDGLRELQLAIDLPADTLQKLNQPSDGSAWHHGGPGDDAPPLLMAMTLRTRKELHGVFQLTTLAGRLAAWFWFFTAGAKRLGLAPVIAPHWMNWCQAPTMTGPVGFDLPRLAFLKWNCDSSFRKQHPLQTTVQRDGLLAWYEDTLEQEDDWHWHRQSPAQRVDDWLACYSTHVSYLPPGDAFGVNLIGFALGELGIGEDIRTAARSCDALGIAYSIVNIPAGSNVRQEATALMDKLVEDPRTAAPYPINVFCLTGFSTAMICTQQGNSLFENRYNIGWWPWELPVWPGAFEPLFGLVDEVWAATDFNLAMYRQATDKPVHKVPIGVYMDAFKPRSRKHFGLPPRQFLFLYIFDANSYPKRKNPQAAVAAFQRAFPQGHSKDKVGLVFKTMNGRDDNPEWLAFKAACQGDERIYIIEDTLDKDDVHALIDGCDAYLSLHRAEGFGRTMAEALMLGKPVIATDYSGNVDFVTPETGFPVAGRLIPVETGDYPFIDTRDQAVWCEVDVDAAATQLKRALQAAKEQPDDIAARALKAQGLFKASVRCLGERLQTLKEDLCPVAPSKVKTRARAAPKPVVKPRQA